MAQVDAPNNDRTDAVLVTMADGTVEEIEIPDELKAEARVYQVALTPETIEALGEAIAKAVKKR